MSYRRAILRLLSLCGLLAVSPAHAEGPRPAPWAASPSSAAIAGLTTRLVSDTLLVLDSNTPLTAGPSNAYHAVRVKNTGLSTIVGLRANLVMGGTGFALGGSPVAQRAAQYVGTLAPGDSTTVFWYVQYPRTIGAAGTASVTFTDASSNTASRTDNLITYSSISSGTGGQLASIGVLSTDALGATVSSSVTYTYGNVGADNHFQLQPAGNADFNAGCFQLVSVRVTASTTNALPVGLTNTLYIVAAASQGGSSHDVTVQYVYRSICIGQTTFSDAYASQTSGNTNYKYSSNFGTRTGNPGFPAGTNLYTAAKTVSDSLPKVNAPISYSITFHNPYTVPTTIDSIIDVLPSGAVFDSIATASGVLGANSSVVPGSAATGTLRFIGIPALSYVIPASGSLTLTYWLRLTGAPASYTNSAAGYINNIVVGGSSVTATARSQVADLSVTKTLISGGTPMQGDTLRYAVQVWNRMATSQTVTLTDSLPSGTTFLSATHSPVATGNLLTWAGFTLASDSSRTDTIRVVTTASGNLTNVARINVPVGDPDSTTNRAAASVTVAPAAANLQVTKQRIGPASPIMGDTLVYLLVVSNQGPKAASSTVLTDSLPAGLTFVRATNSPVQSGRLLTWPAFVLASGASRNDTIRVLAPTAGSFTNVARVGSTEVDSDTTNNRAAESPATTVGARANLSASKTVLGPALPRVADTVSFLVSVRNDGPAIATGVTMTDSLPVGVTFVRATGAPTRTGRALTWTAFALDTAATRSDTVFVIATAVGTLDNVLRVGATEFDPDSTNNRATTSTAIAEASADLRVTKGRVAPIGTPSVGDTLTYVLTTSNTGPSTASGVVLVDSLPAGLTFLSGTNAPSLSGRRLSWGAFALASGASRSDTIRVQTISAGSYGNIARVSGAETDPDTTNNRVTESPATTVDPLVNLAASKTTFGPATVLVGDTLRYQLTVVNLGPSGATGVTMLDSLPTGVTFVRASHAPTLTGRALAWPTFALDTATTRTDTVVVLATAAGTLDNVLRVGAVEVDRDSTDNRAVASKAIGAMSSDLQVVKSRVAPAGTPAVGDTLTYVLTSSNSGPSPASGIVLVDSLPAGLAFLTGTNAPSLSGRRLSWGAFTLASGASRTDTIRVRATSAGSYANVARVSGAEADPDTTNNRVVESPVTVVDARSHLIAAKTLLGPSAPMVGDTLRYLVTVTNVGPSQATGIVMLDSLPASLTFVRASRGPTVTGRAITWAAVTLDSGAVRADTLLAIATTSTTVVNVFRVRGNEVDPDTTTHRVTQSQAILPPTANLSLAKVRLSPATPGIGDTLVYLLTASNSGPRGATGVTLTDSLPTGLGFVRASRAPTVTGRKLTWPTFTLASGASRTDTVFLSAPVAGTYANIARLVGAEQDPDTTNNRVIESPATVVSGGINLVARKSVLWPSMPLVGDTVAFLLTVQNVGPFPATGVTMVDSLPRGLTFVRASNAGVLTGTAVTWAAYALASGATRTDTVLVIPSAAETVVNILRVQGNEPESDVTDNRVTTDLPVSASRTDLRLAKVRIGNAAPMLGDTLVYLLTTTNVGPSPATGIMLTDSLPSGLTFVVATRAPVVSGRLLTWPAFALASNGSRVDTVRVRAAVTGSFVNSARVQGTEVDPDLTNNRAIEPQPTLVGAVSDLQITKVRSGPVNPVQGDTLIYVLTTTNRGPSPASTVTITDSLPAHLRALRASAGGTLSGQRATWLIDAFVAGTTRRDTVWAVATATGNAPNVGRVSSASPDPDTTSNRATASSVIGAPWSLHLSKRAVGTAVRGSALAFDLVARNDGPGVLVDTLVITDSLPSTMTYDGAAGANWIVSVAGSVVTAKHAGPLAAGDSLTLRILTRLTANATGALENVATLDVVSGRTDRIVHATSGMLAVKTPTAAVALGITVDRPEVELLDPVRFTTRLTALTAIPDPALALTITRPAGFALVPGSIQLSGMPGSTGAAAAVGSGLAMSTAPTDAIRIPVGALPAGAVVVVSFTARPGAQALAQPGLAEASLFDGTTARVALADVRVQVRSNTASDEAYLVGRVSQACGTQQVGVAAVRLILEDGRTARTDRDGRYSFQGLMAQPHLLRVDGASLPVGARVVTPDRAVVAADGGATIAVRLQRGEMGVADVTLTPAQGDQCAPAAPVAPAGDTVPATTSDTSPARHLLLSALVHGRVEQWSRDTGAAALDAGMLEESVRELSSWSRDSSAHGTLRAAMLLDGRLSARRSLTLRLDTERPQLDRFFKDIRPDELYPLLGDGAATAALAPARGRVFGDLHYDALTLRFGDLLVPQGDAGTTQLARYPRVISGGMAAVDGRHGNLTGWVSRTTSRFVVQDFPASTSTGLLQLNRADALMGSETVSLITMDRAHPGVQLSAVALERFVDYTIEPGSGRLVLRRLVSGYDDAMNPVIIRVAFEATAGGEVGWLYGGSGNLAIRGVGLASATMLKDDDPFTPYQLGSIGTSFTISRGLTLGGELATSQQDGVDGLAGRATMAFASGGLRLDGRYQEVGSNFVNPAAGIVADRREATIVGRFQLDSSTTLGGEFYRSGDRDRLSTSTGEQLYVARRWARAVEADVGIRHVAQDGLTRSSLTLPSSLSGTSARARMRVEFNQARAAAVTGEFETALGGDATWRAALGVGAQLLPKTRVYLGQEFHTSVAGPYDLSSQSRRDQTVFGLQSEYRPGQQLFSEYRIGSAVDGRVAASVIGLRNSWKVNSQLALTAIAERTAPSGSGVGYAVGGGAEYRESDEAAASVRAEYRLAPTGDDNFFATAGLTRRLSGWAAVLAQTSVGWQPTTDALSARSRIGLVLRGGAATHMLAARYEHHLDRTPLGDSATSRRSAQVLALHASIPLGTAARLRGQLGTKFVSDNAAGTAVQQRANLATLRYTRDLSERLDIGVAGRLLGDAGFAHRTYGAGGEVGMHLFRGMRVATGYNLFGFTDKELAPTAATQRGFYLDLVMTATESIFGWQ